MKGIIAEILYPKHSSLLWTIQKANMSRYTKNVVVILCKTIMANLLTISHILIKPITSLENPKDYLEASLFIR